MERVAVGAATVTLSGLREVEAAARLAVTDGVDDEIGRRLRAILDSARARWPVRTGRSRAGLERTRLVRDERQQHRIRNDVDYADDVHARGTRATSWDTLVVGPVTRSRLELELTLGRTLERQAQRAVDRAG